MKSLLGKIIRQWPTITIDIHELEMRVRERFPTTADYQLQGGYQAFVQAVQTAMTEGWLEEIKRAPSNGREPALKARYRRVHDVTDRSDIEHTIGGLHAALDGSYYRRASLAHWERDREAILALNTFLRRSDAATELSIPCSVNQRSLQAFGDEKLLSDRGEQILIRLGLRWSWLNVIEMTEPFFAEKYRFPVRQVLVVENQDTYHTFRRVLNEGGSPSLSSVDLLIYGEGHKVVGSLAQLEHVYGIRLQDLEIRYFGDIDPEGLDILHQSCVHYPTWSIRPDEPLYEALLDHGVARNWNNPWTDRLDSVGHHFSDALRERLQSVASAGQWFPQEGLRYSFFRLEVPIT